MSSHRRNVVMTGVITLQHFKPSKLLTLLNNTNYHTTLPCYTNEKCNMVYYGISVSLILCHQPSVLLRRQNIAPRLKSQCNILSPQQNFRLMTKITLQKFHNIPYLFYAKFLTVEKYMNEPKARAIG